MSKHKRRRKQLPNEAFDDGFQVGVSSSTSGGGKTSSSMSRGPEVTTGGPASDGVSVPLHGAQNTSGNAARDEREKPEQNEEESKKDAEERSEENDPSDDGKDRDKNGKDDSDEDKDKVDRADDEDDDKKDAKDADAGKDDKSDAKDGLKNAAEDAEGAKDGMDKASEIASKMSDAGQAADGAADAASKAEAMTSAAGSAASGAGAPIVTPKDIKDAKDIGLKGVRNDVGKVGKDLLSGDLTGALNNRTVQKAGDVATRVPEPTTAAVGAGVRVVGSFADHGGEIDLKKPQKILSADNAKALAGTVKDLVPTVLGQKTSEQPPEADDKESAKDKLGLDSTEEDEGKEKDAEKDGEKEDDEDSDEGSGKKDDKKDDKDEKDDEKKDKEDEEDPDGKEKSLAEEEAEEQKEEEKEKADKENADKKDKDSMGKKIAQQGVNATSNVVAFLAPKILIIKLIYAFAQFIYMLLMSLIQIIAQAVCWLLGVIMWVWSGICTVFSAVGSFVGSVVGMTLSTIQSVVVGVISVGICIVGIIFGVAALRYDDELQNMLATDKGIVFSVGCSEVEKSTWGKLKEAFTNDPVSSLSDQQEVVIKQVAAFMKSDKLPAGAQDDAYIYGVLGNAYALSELDPLYVQDDPLGVTMGNVFEDDMKTYRRERVWNSPFTYTVQDLGRFRLQDQTEYVRVTRRADTYAYGIGLFQFTTYRSAFLDYCYDNSDALTNFEGYSDPLSNDRMALNDDDVYDWFTVAAQMSYLVEYPVKVMFFTEEYDPEALEADGIGNVEEDIDYSNIAIGWWDDGLTDEELRICYATTLFLGTYERPARYLAGGDDRADVIARRCEIAVSLSRKCKDDALLTDLDNEWAEGVVGRVVSGGNIATLGAIQSGYTNCGMDTATWNLTTPATVAITYSHPADLDEDDAAKEPTIAYDYIVKTLNDIVGDPMYDLGMNFSADWGAVGYAYIVSGYDTSIPMGLSDQLRYYQSSSRWSQIADIMADGGTADYDTAEKREALLQPGDVLVEHNALGIAKCTYMYVGNGTVLEVVGIGPEELSDERYQVYADKELVRAAKTGSDKREYPHLAKWSMPSALLEGEGVLVFRCTAPEQNYEYRDLVRYGAPENAA